MKKLRKFEQTWKRWPGTYVYLNKTKKTLWQNSRCIIIVSHCVHCTKGEKRQRQLAFRFFSSITGVQTNMLLIIFFGLIAKLALVCGDCDIGTSEVDDFDWNKVGIIVLTWILKLAALKLVLVIIFHFWFQTRSLNRAYQLRKSE